MTRGKMTCGNITCEKLPVNQTDIRTDGRTRARNTNDNDSLKSNSFASVLYTRCDLVDRLKRTAYEVTNFFIFPALFICASALILNYVCAAYEGRLNLGDVASCFSFKYLQPGGFGAHCPASRPRRTIFRSSFTFPAYAKRISKKLRINRAPKKPKKHAI